MGAFRYSLNASTIRGTQILRQIEVAAAAGYAGLELWFADVDAHLATGGSLAEVRRALEDHGLAVPSLIYIGDWFAARESDWPRIRESCIRRFEQAAVLGAPHVIAAPPTGVADAEIGARRYRELLEAGDRIGSLPAMEFLGFVEQFNTIEAALDIIRRAAHPKGSTVLDPFHIFRGGGSMQSISKLAAGQIAVAHFNDTPDMPPRTEQHDTDRVWPEDGHLDLRQYLTRLAALGYNSWLSLELFREDLWRQDPLEVSRVGLEKMRHSVMHAQLQA